MRPALRHGQIVWCRETHRVKSGQVVVAFVKGREVIKRVQSVDQHKVTLAGDNTDASTDSRTYGPILDHYIEGVVIWPRVNN